MWVKRTILALGCFCLFPCALFSGRLLLNVFPSEKPCTSCLQSLQPQRGLYSPDAHNWCDRSVSWRALDIYRWQYPLASWLSLSPSVTHGGLCGSVCEMAFPHAGAPEALHHLKALKPHKQAAARWDVTEISLWVSGAWECLGNSAIGGRVAPLQSACRCVPGQETSPQSAPVGIAHSIEYVSDFG